MRRQWSAGAIERARASSAGRVMPACWQERRALRRLADRGLARPVVGLPDVWFVRV